MPAAKRACLREDRERISAALGGIVPAGGGVVGEAIRYAVLGDGQRLRPILALRVARTLAGDEAVALRAGLAVELLHAASLVVDDLPCMDDAELRRNRPALHRAFGEATALLASFGLVSLAARTALGDDVPPWALLRLVEFQRQLLATLDCSALIGGQALDLGLEKNLRRPSPETLAALKTAPLFELAARGGVLAAEAEPPAAAGELIGFGREFGIAFQLADDFLDGELGSPAPALRALRRARHRLAPFGETAFGLMELLDYLDARITQEDRRHR